MNTTINQNEPTFEIGNVIEFEKTGLRQSKLDKYILPLVENFNKLELRQGFMVSLSDAQLSEAVRRKLIISLRDKIKGQQCATKRMTPISFYLIRIQ